MQQDTTPVYLKEKLPFPLTVAKVNVREGDVVKKFQQLFTYKYADFETVALSKQDEMDNKEPKKIRVEYVGTYECPCSGTIQSISVSPGDVIENSNNAVVEVLEPCSHPIQYGGLCAVCGKAVDEEDYSGFNDKDRAPIAMAHGTTNLTVSSKEAANIEKGSTERLLGDKKLSLVVDLDQTVIHATVDPTVGEWMSDPTNPNYDAIKDVKSFSLEEPAVVPPNYTGPPPPPNIRWYYVKLRPGLQEFLEKASKLYELHIYTMATRSYAKEIGKIIDPDGIYFGDRILSRDESGSLTQKSLKRLFPVDTSMVIVIDDRGDVWNWSPNLIKVIPYDFFVGIGDINSSFLPRQQVLLGPSKRRKSVNILEDKLQEEEEEDEELEEVDERPVIDEEAVSSADESAIIDDENEPDDESTRKIEKIEETSRRSSKSSRRSSKSSRRSSKSSRRPSVGSPIDRMVEMGNDNGALLAMQASERTTVLEQQEHERPLAKMQQNLEKIIEEEETKNSGNETHNLLCDDDSELEKLGQALVRIHNEFYFEVDRNHEEKSDKRPDVKDIMSIMKGLVFKGCVFLLSGILPIGTPLDSADIVIWAKSFGATFVSDYNTSVTHVICKNPGTFKVRLAKSVDSKVNVVNPDWLFSCMSNWEHVSEKDYAVEVDGLMSQEQVANFLKFHNHVGATFDASSLDWNEIDEEMREFMGSDYEDEDDEDDNKDATERPDSAKRTSTELDDPSIKRQKLEDLSEEEYERTILDDLADLEED